MTKTQMKEKIEQRREYLKFRYEIRIDERNLYLKYAEDDNYEFANKDCECLRARISELDMILSMFKESI